MSAKLIKHIDTPTAFEGYYNQVRHDEGRLLGLDLIRQLPYTPENFRHHQEWNLRIKSTERLLKYLDKRSNFSLLDLGCGNGWFLLKLTHRARRLTGVDINLLELEQAREILTGANHADLHYGDIFSLEFDDKFDFIVLNGSAQYFPSLPKLITSLLSLLNPNGEIHIVDSPLYKDANAAEKAHQRSEAYYQKEGVKEMSAYYYHHTLDDLSTFKYQIMYNPHTLKRKLLNKITPDSPLYWVKVTG